jgi:hypothetical protein
MLFPMAAWIDEFGLPYSNARDLGISRPPTSARTCITLGSITTASIANGLVTSPAYALTPRRSIEKF